MLSRNWLARFLMFPRPLAALLAAATVLSVAWALFNGLGAFQLPGRVDIELLDLRLDVSAVLGAAAGAMAVTFLIAIVAAESAGVWKKVWVPAMP